MEKKYKLSDETKTFFTGLSSKQEHILHRIVALREFKNYDTTIKVGEKGGWVESEKNLSHEGECWISENAIVCGNATVKDNAWISENAQIFDNAIVCDRAVIYEDAKIYGNAKIYNNSEIHGNAEIYENAEVEGDITVAGNTKFHGDAYSGDWTQLDGNYDIDFRPYLEHGEPIDPTYLT